MLKIQKVVRPKPYQPDRQSRPCACMCAYVCVCAYMHVCVCMCMCVCVRACVCVIILKDYMHCYEAYEII